MAESSDLPSAAEIAEFERGCLTDTEATVSSLFAAGNRQVTREGVVPRSVQLQGKYPDTKVVIMLDDAHRQEGLQFDFPIWAQGGPLRGRATFDTQVVAAALLEAT